MTQIEKLKVRLGISTADTSKDELLTAILEDAAAEILDFTNRSLITNSIEPLQRELAIIYYNRQGVEGEVSRSEGGISVSYSTDIPEAVKNRLNAYRLLKGAKIANASTQ
jgi:hypothetical protein